MKEKILAALKPKVKDRGFSDKAINSFVDYLAKRITKEEEIESAIDEAGDILEMMQSEVSRQVDAVQKKKKPETEKPKNEPEKVEEAGEGEGDEKVPGWAKKLIADNAELRQEIAGFKAKDTGLSRKQELEAALKDAPEAYRKKILKDFDRTASTFKDDDDFSAWKDEQVEEAKLFAPAPTEPANGGTGGFPRPLVTPPSNGGGTTKAASKEELDKVAASLQL